MTRVSEVHQLSDSRDVRDELANWQSFLLVAVHDVRRAIIVLTADKCPTVHLEVRQNRRWENAAKFKKLCSLKLDVSPAWMAVRMESVVCVCHPRCVQS